MSAGFAAAIGRVAHRVTALAPDAADSAASAIRTEAAARTPVASGRLRDGWHVERVDAAMRRVVNDVPYAAAVEYGNRARPGVAMARGAVAAVALRPLLEADR